MSNIPTNVELSCASHPRLKPGAALPRNGVATVSQELLFALGTLTLQRSSKPTLATYALVEHKWTHLQGLYADWLDFQANQIVTDASGEDLTQLSEIVGVALGIAALDAEFNIQINRFERFNPGGSARRVDFGYFADGQRFFHETKGTTYATTVQKMCNAIGEQKESTLATLASTVAAPGTLPVAVSGLTGSVALYGHVDRPTTCCLVTLTDPPVGDQEGTRRATEADELACVLRYYRNFYRVTLPIISNIGSLRLDVWLDQVISLLERGAAAPDTAPSDLRTNAKVRLPGAPDSIYGGALFDARYARRSLLRYASLREASANIASPISFVGVSDEVTEMIRTCRWDDLLSYRDTLARRRTDGLLGREVLNSGVLCERVEPGVVDDGASATVFARMRQVALISLKHFK